MFKGLKFNGHCVAYGVLAILYAVAALHLGGDVVDSLCDAARAAVYGVLLWLHGGGGQGGGSASRDGSGHAGER